MKEFEVEVKGDRHWKRKYKLKVEAFSEIENEEQAYWLGFLAADGCVQDYELVVTLAIVRDKT